MFVRSRPSRTRWTISLSWAPRHMAAAPRERVAVNARPKRQWTLIGVCGAAENNSIVRLPASAFVRQRARRNVSEQSTQEHKESSEHGERKYGEIWLHGCGILRRTEPRLAAQQKEAGVVGTGVPAVEPQTDRDAEAGITLDEIAPVAALVDAKTAPESADRYTDVEDIEDERTPSSRPEERASAHDEREHDGRQDEAGLQGFRERLTSKAGGDTRWLEREKSHVW